LQVNGMSPDGGGPLGPLGHGRDDQEGVGEHRQGDFRISDPPAGHRY
jgi:hypothetical protein